MYKLDFDKLARIDREHMWHPFTQMAEYEPLFIEWGEGATIIDSAGRRYLDGTSSLWCNVHGHRHPTIDAAIRAQLDRIAHTTQLGLSNSTTVRLAERLLSIAPKGLEHVFFSDDGATAIEVALKLAFQYWQQRPNPQSGKTAYVALGDAYHGDTLGSVSVGGVARFHAMFEPLLFKPLRLQCPDTYRTPEGVAQDDLAEHYASELEALLEAEHSQIAAVVLEPLVQCAAGMVMHPPGYLRRVRELTQKYNVLLIADEVAVGFGRTGKMFACEYEGVSPDLMCVAKGLTGGYLPMAATLATHEIWNAFLGGYGESKQFFHGHTYGGNPLGAAAALGSLDVFEQEHVLEKLPAKIEHLKQRLSGLSGHPHVGQVRQRGLIAGIELVADRASKAGYPWHERRGWRVCEHARSRGVMLRPLGNVVVIFPPLSITIDELDTICDAVIEGVERATAR